MRRVRLAYLALGAALGAYLPFVAVIQTAKGFDPLALGLIGAIGAAVGVIAAPVWGHLGDVVLGRRRVLVLAALVGAGLLAGYGLAGLPLVLAGLWIAKGIFIGTTNPTMDAVALVVVRERGAGSFARLRVPLSLAFGVAAIGAGVLYLAYGYAIAPFVAAAGFAVFAACALTLPDPPRTAAAAASTGRRGGASSAAFAAQPRLPIVLLTFGLGTLGMVAAFGWRPLRIEELGGSSTDVALAAGLESFAEVPAFIVAGLLAARLGLRTLYGLSALLMGTCVVVLALLTDPSVMIGVRVVNGIAYAGMTVASVSALGTLLPVSLQATGQSLMAMTASIASILLGVVGGSIYQFAGAPALFAVTGSATLLAAVLGWLVLPARDRGAGPTPLTPGGSSA
ncbi:MAG: MFS transporter [Chloroflexota bacterium]